MDMSAQYVRSFHVNRLRQPAQCQGGNTYNASRTTTRTQAGICFTVTADVSVDAISKLLLVENWSDLQCRRAACVRLSLARLGWQLS